jgi:hypothetical protein
MMGLKRSPSLVIFAGVAMCWAVIVASQQQAAQRRFRAHLLAVRRR